MVPKKSQRHDAWKMHNSFSAFFFFLSAFLPPVLCKPICNWQRSQKIASSQFEKKNWIDRFATWCLKKACDMMPKKCTLTFLLSSFFSLPSCLLCFANQFGIICNWVIDSDLKKSRDWFFWLSVARLVFLTVFLTGSARDRTHFPSLKRVFLTPHCQQKLYCKTSSVTNYAIGRSN